MRTRILLAVAAAAFLLPTACADQPNEPVIVAEPTSSAEPTPAPGAWPTVALAPAWSELDHPLGLAADGTGDLYVVEKTGRVRVLLPGGQVKPGPFLDISGLVSDGSEQGLLGLAFSPRYAEDRAFYVDYTDRAGDTVVARYTALADGSAADPASAITVLEVDQPYSNHNGGCVAFGPDGMLYIGMGDGGAGADPHGNGQDGGVLLGKVLRIDVGATGTPLPAGKPYRVPADNPFVSAEGYRPEIWALGLRNPWRFSFDRATGDLWIGDVGQNRWEEIDVAPAAAGGRNYGWNRYEGKHPFLPGVPESAPGFTEPVVEYGRDAGYSVTGGYVYRGAAYPGLRGVYLYADYGSGRVWGLRRGGGGAWENRELLDTELGISSFGQGADGELYLCDLNGTVQRLTAE